MVNRIQRIMKRAVHTLRQQLKQGDFQPTQFEASFADFVADDALSLRGRIDRIDLCETEQKVYVKVVDYKSGQKRFDLTALYHGLQLQLAVYLDVAMEETKKSHPDKEVVPAAALYYRVFDPLIEAKEDMSPAEVEERLLYEQSMTGIVSEDEETIKRLDRSFTTKSWVIPVARHKDGGWSSASGVLPPDDFAAVSHYLKQKIVQMGQEIKGGEIAVYPYEYKKEHGCQYCEYQHVCGFDLRLPGYRSKKMSEMGREEALASMKSAM
jgi:ATP-dependent helicase/nuclease subunit B